MTLTLCEANLIGQLEDAMEALGDTPLEWCAKCNSFYTIGMWPMCRGNPEDHGKVTPQPAQMGAPTVVFSDGKGNYDYPLADGRAPRGFEQRIELRNTRERDAFERQESATARIASAAAGEGLDAIKSMTPQASVGDMKAWRDSLTTPVAKAFMDKVIDRKQKGTLGGSVKKKEGSGAMKIHVNHNYVGKKKVKS